MTCKCRCTCHQTDKKKLLAQVFWEFDDHFYAKECQRTSVRYLELLAKEALRAVEEAIIKLWSDSGWDQACLPRLQDYLKRELLGDDGK